MTRAMVASMDVVGPGAVPLREAAVRRRRRPGLWAAGATVLAGSALTSAVLVGHAGGRVPVLAVAGTVHIGQPLTDANLTVARVAADPALQPVPASERAAVVGQLAAVELRPGTLLTRDQLTSARAPAAGEQLVGLPAKPGQLPARGLVPGDRVMVVATPGDQGGGAEATPSATRADRSTSISARVVEVGPADADGRVTVDVAVPEKDGSALAGWGSTGRVALILLPVGG